MLKTIYFTPTITPKHHGNGHTTLKSTGSRPQRHINNKIFVQCHRCQRWGHATANCHAQAKCVKCAGDHLTRDCQLGNKITPKCVNCDGDHTANNIKCPEYQKKLEAAQERRKRNTKNEKYVPAPLPKENAWEKRKKNTGSERADSSHTE
jgi:hypothetical protein